MHIILTQQELKNYIQRYLNIPSDVEVTISLAPEDTVKEPQQNTDGWIVNTSTLEGHPLELNEFEDIEVELNNGKIYGGVSSSWYSAWDTTEDYHIVKYRKVTK